MQIPRELSWSIVKSFKLKGKVNFTNKLDAEKRWVAYDSKSKLSHDCLFWMWAFGEGLAIIINGYQCKENGIFFMFLKRFLLFFSLASGFLGLIFYTQPGVKAEGERRNPHDSNLIAAIEKLTSSAEKLASAMSMLNMEVKNIETRLSKAEKELIKQVNPPKPFESAASSLVRSMREDSYGNLKSIDEIRSEALGGIFVSDDNISKALKSFAEEIKALRLTLSLLSLEGIFSNRTP